MTRKHELKKLKSHSKTNSYLPELVDQYQQKKISRRDFVKMASALGMSAAAISACSREEKKPATETTSSTTESAPAAETTTAASDGIKRGGTFRIDSPLQELKDPQNFEWIEGSNVTRGICEYLTEYGADGQVKPYLAESWKVADDGKTFDIFLRKGVKWSNGDDFTAEDVAHNFTRWRKEGNESINNSEWGANVLSDVETVNDHQVRLHLAKPDVTVAHRLFAYPTQIVHRSFDDNGADLSKNAIGTGPFSLEFYRVGEGAKVVRREGYWGGPDGLGDAYLDAVHFIDLGEDEQAPISALQSGQIDWVYKISPKQYDTVKGIANTQILDVVTAQTPVIRFNIENMSDARVREAISLAASNQEILDIAYAGKGIVGENHHTAPIQPDYYDLGAKPTQNLKKAAELIEAAGMKDKEIKLVVGNTQGNWEQDACQVLQEQCKKAGINLQLEVLPQAKYWEEWDKWDFSLTFWTHRPLAVMLHKLAYRSDAKWNEVHFKSETYDAALDAAAGSPDATSASQHMKTCQEELQNNFVMVQPFWIQLYAGGSAKVKNYPKHQQEYYPYHRLWIDA